MKKNIFIITFLLFLPYYILWGQNSYSSNKNYRLTRTPQISTSDISNLNQSNCLYAVEYFNDAGRLEETVLQGWTPEYNDLISPIQYDGIGNISQKWLPTPIENNSPGAFHGINMDFEDISRDFYDDWDPLTYYNYDQSPAHRIKRQAGPGEEWQCDYPIEINYATNKNDDSNFSYSRFTATYTQDTLITIRKLANYENKELFVTITKDENGNIMHECKNQLCHTFVVRQWPGNNYDTYYLYDDFNNVIAVLPPAAADGMTQGSSYNNNSEVIRKYAYLYRYDKRGNCIAKKLPGTEWTHYIYDRANRLIFTQDGEAKQKGEWTFTIPDVFNRTIVTGICKNVNNQQITSDRFSEGIIRATYSFNGSIYGYNIQLQQNSGIENLTFNSCVFQSVNYYDNYAFLERSDFASKGLEYVVPESGYGTKDSNAEKTMLTGNLTFTTDSQQEPSYSALYYDTRGRVIQSHATNHLNGKESLFNEYTFPGQTKRKKHIHTASGKTTQTEYYTYTYDHSGRLVETKHKLGSSGVEKSIAKNEYDEVGRLKNTTRVNNSNLSENLNYNVKSWVKSKTGPYFSQYLTYKGTNIENMEWIQNSQRREYTFEYDGVARLTTALYRGVGNEKYGTAYSYDKHGNMLTLQRYGRKAAGTAASSFGLVDNLTMNYAGNQLVNVTEAVADFSLPESNDFKKLSAFNPGYAYNKNGAMTKDLNKGISEIKYNSLNLPTQLTINGTVNNYTYSADGTKLRVAHGSIVTDYVGNIIYENGSLKQILIEGGYIENGQYYFFFTDHLGNTRAVAREDGTVIQQNHYYPFGMVFAETSSENQNKQPYQYNGKELDRKNGLNLYDYSARYMEPALGRFTTMDPMAEKYYSISPYAYCVNNPMRYVDPTGMVYGDPPGFWESFGQGFIKPFVDFGHVITHPIETAKKFAAAVEKATPLELAVSITDQMLRGPASPFAGQLKQMDVIQAVSYDRVNGTTTSAEVVGGQWGDIAFDGTAAAVGAGGAKVAGALGKTTVASTTNIKVGGGASIENISGGELLRIQNAATRINKPISLVGSRAGGTAKPTSDWDYIIYGGLKNSKEWSKIKNSLPGARSIMDNTPRNIDIHTSPVNPQNPFITIYPK